MIINTIIEKDHRYYITDYAILFMIYIFLIQKLKKFWKYKYKLENH